MEFELTEAIAILKRTPIALRSMLLGLSDKWTHENEGGETWSSFDVVGHLIHGERTDWITRAKIILRDVDKNFESFDRFAQFEESRGKELTELLEEFEKLRSANLKDLIQLDISEKDFEKTGIHPEFGEVTLKELLSTWVVHDLNHIAQISRVLAKQYKQEVGPWAKYIGVLDRGEQNSY